MKKAYLDRDLLMDCCYNDVGRSITPNVIMRLPAADVAPVVHGRWIDSPNMMECVVCSNCNSAELSAQVPAPPPWHYKYCPYCGAKMDLEV